MSRLEFENDLMKYVSRRRKSTSLWSKLFKVKSKAVVSVSEPQPVTIKQIVDVPIVENDLTTESEYKQDSQSVFSKMFGWLYHSENGSEVCEEPVKMVFAERILLEDMRVLARISIEKFRQLPVHKIREFKQSNDFATFKGILKKHGLSKE